MSSTYRDALGAAQTRIAALELALAEGAKANVAPATVSAASAPRVPALPDLPDLTNANANANASAPRKQSSLLAGFFACSIVVCWGLLTHATVVPDRLTMTTIEVPTEPNAIHYGVTAYASPKAHPFFASRASVQAELVGLFRSESGLVSLGAVNPTSLKIAWMTKPFTFDSAVADVHMAGIGRYVGVASGDTVYSVDTMTHSKVFQHAFDSEVLFVCPLPNGIELAVQTGVSMTILHLTSGEVRDATPQDTKQCERSISIQEGLDLWKPTKEDVAAARHSKAGGLKPKVPMSESGEYRLLPCLPREGTGDILLMLGRSDDSFRWQAPALAPNDGILGNRATSLLTKTHVLTRYVTSTGDLRLVARDVRDGRLAWKTTVPGASMDDLVAEDDKLYALADGTIHRLDLTTGREELVVGSW